MYRYHRGAAIAAGLLLLTTALAGCSSSQSAAGSSSQPSGASATGGPISVGFLNQGQGTMAFPDFAAGTAAAVTYLNGHGGISGRQVKLVSCDTDGTAASSVACANRFVQDKVPVVLQGIDFQSDAALPILAGAGIPMVGHTAFGAAQANSPDAFFFGAATGAYLVVPLVVMAKNLGLHSVSYTAADVPTNRAFVAANLAPAAKALGLKMTAHYYPPTAPNYVTVFAAAAANHPDAVFFTAAEPDCTGLVAAAKTLGYKGKVFAGSCSSFIKQDPTSASGVFTDSDLYLTDNTSGISADKSAEVKIYLAAMAQGYSKYQDGFAQMTFSSMMDLASVLKTISGDITGSSVLASLSKLQDMSSFMGQVLKCDGKQWPGEKSVCASGLMEYQVKGADRVPFTDGFVNGRSYVG